MTRPSNAPRLPEAEIVARYRAGEPQTMLALRARIPQHRIRAILERHAIPIRSSAQARRRHLQDTHPA